VAPDPLVTVALLRWLDSIALAAVIGSQVFDLFVLPHDTKSEPERSATNGRVRAILAVATVLLLVVSSAEFVARASSMAGTGIRAGVDALPVVLAQSHYGKIWAARLVALAFLGASCASSTRSSRKLGLGLALVVAATTALTGHAADWGDIRPIAVNDWLHVTASAAWVGGLLCLIVVPTRDARASDSVLLTSIAARFSRVAGLSLLIVAATGVANLWVQLSGIAALARTSYGRVLGAKLLLVFAITALGALNRYAVLPRLRSEENRRTPGASRTQRRFRRFVVCELVLGSFVFGCTAILGQLPPPRHEPMRQAAQMAARASGSAAPFPGGRPIRCGRRRCYPP